MRRKAIFYLLSIMLLLGACESNTKSEGDDQTEKDALLKAEDPEELNVRFENKTRIIGAQVSTLLIKSLSDELKSALKGGDVPKAMDICNIKAIPMTQELAKKYNVKVSRVTDRFRNPDNRADEADMEVLAVFNDQMLKGELKDYLVTKKEESDDQITYIYNQPLILGDVCLNCHGDSETFSPELAGVLKDLYPNDLAIDYEKGDLRGIIKVEVTEKK